MSEKSPMVPGAASAAVLNWPQQLRIYSRQSGQGLRVQSIVFSAALRNEVHLLWMGHDQGVAKFRFNQQGGAGVLEGGLRPVSARRSEQ
jgi:hypothetical protein